jgi:hypothetical protein
MGMEAMGSALLPKPIALLLLWFTGETGMGMVGCMWSPMSLGC